MNGMAHIVFSRGDYENPYVRLGVNCVGLARRPK